MKKTHILLLSIVLVAFANSQSVTLVECSKVGTLSPSGCTCPLGSASFTIGATAYCLPIAPSVPQTTFSIRRDPRDPIYPAPINTSSSSSATTTTTTPTTSAPTSPSTSTTFDPNCKSFTSTGCLECKDGYLLTDAKNCMLKSPLCADYGNGTKCISCQPGFKVQDGLCYPLAEEEVESSDPNCLIADEKNKKICVKCIFRAYLDINTGACKQVNPLCNEYDASGNCLTCWPGYALSNGTCAVKVMPTPPNCNKIDNNGVCVLCSSDAYMDANKNCIQKDTNCKSYTSDYSGCVNCYPGFIVDKATNKCTPNPDPYCSANQGDKCIACSKGFYLDNGVCMQNDPLCKDSDNGKCNSCYVGYALQQNKCVKISNSSGLSNCKNVDSTGKCSECSFRYYLNFNKDCIKVSDFCQTYDKERGYCTSCYKGYTINPYTGDCTIPKL